jgi:hypothetical protein
MLYIMCNHGGCEIFLTGPDGAHPASYAMGTSSFLGVKQTGRGVDHPPLSNAEVKERIKLYLYSPSGSVWPVLGRNLYILCAPVETYIYIYIND